MRNVPSYGAVDTLGGEYTMTPTRNDSTPGATTADDRSGAGHRSRQPPARRRGSRRKTTLPADGYVGRAHRARAEPMLVRPLRDGRYVVESEGGTYVVDVERSRCTCPDSAIRGARCKHRRRVAAEIARGLLPAPDERERVCAVCGDPTFEPIGDRSPALCDRHDHERGERVRDRETGALLVVVDRVPERADDVRTADGRLVADYRTNANYGDHEPVFAAVYVDALPAGVDPDEVLAGAAAAPRYLFPASRLVPDRSGPPEHSHREDRADRETPTGR
ncbi:SWIM zinc finger family protein [Halobellus sp. GM3]|uniref:SWIM zinc finger family protein n=1 Tax=Halobellus sp. GM3 TaxID=3458410 RepID=UPI00403DBDAF